jgi:ABC-type multidrug transport system fused ATPase/permease subunit
MSLESDDSDVITEDKRVKSILDESVVKMNSTSKSDRKVENALTEEKIDSRIPSYQEPVQNLLLQSSLLLYRLSKTYPPTIWGGTSKQALKGLSLNLRPGEKFGLLGINMKKVNSMFNIFIIYMILIYFRS